MTSVEQEEVHTSIGNASRDSSTVEESQDWFIKRKSSEIRFLVKIL